MLVLLFHTELQRTDDFSSEVRAGENSFPLTLQDFHKSYFKGLFISCFAFLHLLSLIWTLSFAHIFFSSLQLHILLLLSIAFFLSGSWVHFNLSFAWWSHQVQKTNLTLYHSNFTPVQFLAKESRAGVLWCRPTLQICAQYWKSVKCLGVCLGWSSFEPLGYFWSKDNIWNVQTNKGTIKTIINNIVSGISCGSVWSGCFFSLHAHSAYLALSKQLTVAVTAVSKTKN